MTQHSQLKTRGFGGALAIGCLSVVGFIVVAVGAGMWWMSTKGKDFGADVVNEVLTETVKQSELPDADKQRLIARTNKLTQDFKAGSVTLEDLERVMNKLIESPLWVVATVNAFQEEYIKKAGISEEDKQAAVTQVQRFCRGLYEHKIPKETVEKVLSTISQPDGDGGMRLKEKLSDEELTAVITRIKQESDQAKVPNEPFNIDVVGEILKAIDGALAKK